MLGLKGKINVAVITVIVLTSVVLTLFSWSKAKLELTKAVDTGNLDLVNSVASTIKSINDNEFKMLESVANMAFIRDPELDMHEKWRIANSVTGGNQRYFGLGFFNTAGVGYATTGAWSDLHNRQYLIESMQGRRALQDPDLSTVNGQLCIYYAVPVRDASGRQIGEISAVVDATSMCHEVASIKVGASSRPYILSTVTGKYVAHENSSLVKDGVLVESDSPEGFKPILNKIRQGATGTEVFYDEIQHEKYSVAYQPIPGSDWAVICMAPYKDFYSGISQLLWSMIIIGIITLAVAATLTPLIVKYSLKSLKTVGKAINDIASGEADLTRRLTAETTDEVGHLVTGFNNFNDRLHTIIKELKTSKDELHSYGERMGGMVQQNASFLSQMLSNIKDVNAEIANQHDKMGSTVGAVDKISDALQSLRELLSSQKQGVEQASAAVTEMIGNINSVSGSIEKMATEFDVLQHDIDNGIARQHEVNEQVQQIEQQSKALNEANSIISSIASQTNLLAMNAAIEAAHAGEAGKGFAVVADEIRKLSETSSSQSKGIGQQIKSIRASISNVVVASDLSDKAFTSVIEKINDTGSLVHQIKIATEEQTEGSKQIAEALSYMNDITRQVGDASEDVDNARQGITGDVNSLRQSSDSVKDLVKTMETSVKHIEEDDDSLMNIATSINTSIYNIGNQIDQFKV